MSMPGLNTLDSLDIRTLPSGADNLWR